MSMIPAYPEPEPQSHLHVAVPPVTRDNNNSPMYGSLIKLKVGSESSDVQEDPEVDLDQQNTIQTNRRVVYYNNPGFQVATSPSIRIFGASIDGSSLANHSRSGEKIVDAYRDKSITNKRHHNESISLESSVLTNSPSDAWQSAIRLNPLSP